MAAIVNIGAALAYAGDDGGGLTSDACAHLAADLRTVYRVLRDAPAVAAAPPPVAAPPPAAGRSRSVH